MSVDTGSTHASYSDDRRHGQSLPTLAVGFLGQIGLVTGCNTVGVTVSEVTAYPKLLAEEGRPIMATMRLALEEGFSGEACMSSIERNSFMGGFNILVSDGANDLVSSVEVAAGFHARVQPNNGALVTSGMYRSPEMRKGQHLPASDVVRHLRNEQLIYDVESKHSFESVLAILRDRYDLLERGRSNSYRCIASIHTVHSMLSVPKQRRIWVSLGPPPAPMHPYVSVSLDTLMELAPGTYDAVKLPGAALSDPLKSSLLGLA